MPIRWQSVTRELCTLGEPVIRANSVTRRAGHTPTKQTSPFPDPLKHSKTSGLSEQSAEESTVRSSATKARSTHSAAAATADWATNSPRSTSTCIGRASLSRYRPSRTSGSSTCRARITTTPASPPCADLSSNYRFATYQEPALAFVEKSQPSTRLSR